MIINGKHPRKCHFYGRVNYDPFTDFGAEKPQEESMPAIQKTWNRTKQQS